MPVAYGLRVSSIVIAALVLIPRPGFSQCTEPHYRWTEKTEGSLASIPAVKAYVTTILKSWAVLEFTSQAKYKCSDRIGRELKVYSVTGWVTRVKTGETDGDWHIELTSRQNSPVDSCIVLEIPPADLNGNYAKARQDLQGWVDWAANGNVSPPVKLRFIGAAFFDGEHRGGEGKRDKTDGAHGRCNSSARALWELHPVFWVLEP
jgi:hypothetical protein